MPEHHEISNVLLAVEFTAGKATGAPASLDLFVDFRSSGLQYRASRLGYIDPWSSAVRRHGGGEQKERPALITYMYDGYRK